MEIEVKLRLPDADSHGKLLSILAPFHIQTHHQRNTFFDGAAAELSSRRAVLRLRFYEQSQTPRCVVSLKEKAELVGGVSRVEEDEEDLDPGTGYGCVEDPRKLSEVDSRILRRVKQEFAIGELGFVGLGGFMNVRNVYDWRGVKLEVDETVYRFGTLYEIECESSEPDRVKGMIEEFLKEKGIEYSYSEKSKFAAFREGKLPL
ncbi:unnamed protein product [Cuscuta campestris]|uniref:CYTH domain-containing protein n=1 Tax=Cuscuta campestris TaxID=132261 RepID=A0A484LLN3_9ASTE|nr:unnamed protein product [Cuscuta campestris]